MNLGNNIRAIRKDKGIKQKDLANKVGLTVNGLQKIEYGYSQPKKSTLINIANVLGVEPYILMIDEKTLAEEVAKLEKDSTYAKIITSIAEKFNDEDASTVDNYFSLSDEGKKKASEYIELLMQKYKKE